MNKQTVVFWWPDSVFNDVAWKKDPGSIPIELKLLGYNVILVVKKFNSSINPQKLEIIETFDTRRKSNSATNLIDKLRSAISMLKTIHIYNPKAIIIEGDHAEGVLFALLLRICSPIILVSRLKLILMMDANPELVKIRNKSSVSVFYRTLYSFLFDRITTQTQCGYTELVRPKPISKYRYKYAVTSLGCSLERAKSQDDIKVKRYNRILSVGRISYQKGYDLLIRLFAKIVDRFPDWELWIVGLSDDEIYMKSLLKEITELNLCNSVKLFTNLNEDQLAREYEEASIFCLLSRYGSFEIARVEAINFGLPIVITEAACGIQYKNFGSFVCNIEDYECIINSLATLISNKYLRLKISEKQKEAIITWYDVAMKFSELIES